MAQELIDVKVMTPHQILFQGKAFAVSSINSDGKFDILPEHANFITLIENQVVKVIKETQEEVAFTFKQAIVINASNKVAVYAEPQSL